MIFGDILVDAIWSIDAELDEVLLDAKVHEGSRPGIQSQLFAKGPSYEYKSLAILAKQNAEKDKETLVLVVKKLLVCSINLGRRYAS